MVSFQFPCRVSLHRFRIPGTWCCQTLELGPHGEKPQLGLGFCPGTSRWPSDSRLVISLQVSSEGPCQSRLNCRVRDQGRLRFRWRVWVRGRFRVRVSSQELQAPNPQQGRGLCEGLSLGLKGPCRSGSVLGCQGHIRRSAPVRRGIRIPLESCSRAREKT